MNDREHFIYLLRKGKRRAMVIGMQNYGAPRARYLVAVNEISKQPYFI